MDARALIHAGVGEDRETQWIGQITSVAELDCIPKMAEHDVRLQNTDEPLMLFSALFIFICWVVVGGALGQYGTICAEEHRDVAC